jgi:hypothetical protein
LKAPRIAEIYREARSLLRPGGVLGNADHMPDPGLPGLSSRLTQTTSDRASQFRQDTGAKDWKQWWTGLRDIPELAAALAERDAAPPDAAHTGSNESSAWHVAALRHAGFVEAGLTWRGHLDALVVGMNT